MAVEVTFERLDEANRFRAEHPDALCPDDNRASKTVTLVSDVSGAVRERAESLAVAGRIDVGVRERRTLSDRERQQLDARPNWSWQQNGAEAMWVKGTLSARGATEWMDFYEAGEGIDGALTNMEASAERSVLTGAPTGQLAERDPDPESAERMAAVAEGQSQACDHAHDVCRQGDPDACEFLVETCEFTEAEVDAILGVDVAAEVDVGEPAAVGASPFTGIQRDALSRAWGGYNGAIAALEADPDDVEARRHATQAFAAINGIRRAAGQDELEPERLNELGGRLEDIGTMDEPGGLRVLVAALLALVVVWTIAEAFNDQDSSRT